MRVFRSPCQLKTLVHEYAHHLLHGEGAECEKIHQQTREAQAESVAYMVLQHFGLDTGDYSFGYVATWSQEFDVIKRIGDDIMTCSRQIIDLIEEARTEVAA